MALTSLLRCLSWGTEQAGTLGCREILQAAMSDWRGTCPKEYSSKPALKPRAIFTFMPLSAFGRRKPQALNNPRQSLLAKRNAQNNSSPRKKNAQIKLSRPAQRRSVGNRSSSRAIVGVVYILRHAGSIK